jgi:hypothetical protein
MDLAFSPSTCTKVIIDRSIKKSCTHTNRWIWAPRATEMKKREFSWGWRGAVGCCRAVAVSIPPVLFQTRSNLRKMKRNKLREGAGGAGGGKIKQKRLCSGCTIGPTDAASSRRSSSSREIERREVLLLFLFAQTRMCKRRGKYNTHGRTECSSAPEMYTLDIFNLADPLSNNQRQQRRAER